jgi:hypothetical protein
MLAVLMLLAGFAFKIAAVPLHVYAGDVYQGAATPVTAFLAFVPKTSGIVAIIKLLAAVGGAGWSAPPEVVRLLWVLAALTMTVGNVLGLLQENVKRVLAYSSVAHTGYMLVGLTALVAAGAAGLTMAEADRGPRRPRPPLPAARAGDDRLLPQPDRHPADDRLFRQVLPAAAGVGREAQLARDHHRRQRRDLGRLLPPHHRGDVPPRRPGDGRGDGQ